VIVTACLLVGLTYQHPAVVNARLRLVEAAQVTHVSFFAVHSVPTCNAASYQARNEGSLRHQAAMTQGMAAGPSCPRNTLLHRVQGGQWVQTSRPATDLDPAPSRMGWLPEPGVRTTSDAGPPRARLLSSQQQPVSGGSGHAAAADGTATGVAQGFNRSAVPAATKATAAAAEVSVASDTPHSSDAAARPEEPATAQSSSSGSEAANKKPTSGEGEQPVAVVTSSKPAGPPSISAAKDAESQVLDSSSVEQDDDSDPDKPDSQHAGPADTQRTAGGGGKPAGAAIGSQSPEEADNARAAARHGARQPDPKSASDQKPRKPKATKHRKTPQDHGGPRSESDTASKPRDAQPASPEPTAAQPAQKQAPAKEEAKPATDEAGVPSSHQAAAFQQTQQPAAEEHAAPAQRSQPAPAAQKKSWSRYSSHDPGEGREGTWSSYQALPNMHEAHPHYHECGAQTFPGGPHLRISIMLVWTRRHAAP